MYDGTFTTTTVDPNLTMTGTLKDGRKVYVVRDDHADSPDDWEDLVPLTLVGGCAWDYTFGTGSQDVKNAHDRFKYGLLASWHETDDAVARYMRIFHNTTVKYVSLTGRSQSDWAEGYLTLDLDVAAREGIVDTDAALNGAAETWRQYFAGDVYGFIVVNEETGEEDSCWGFYGEPDDLINSGFYGDAYNADELEDRDWAL